MASQESQERNYSVTGWGHTAVSSSRPEKIVDLALLYCQDSVRTVNRKTESQKMMSLTC